jgi:hypothetical protein
MIVQVDVQGRFERIRLKQKLLIEILLRRMTVNNKFGSTVLLTLVPVLLRYGSDTHQLHHLGNGVVHPTTSTRIVTRTVQDGHHKHFVVDLPFERLSDN